jgi:hypothetical protein
MKIPMKIPAFLLLTALSAYPALSFLSGPSLTNAGGGQWQVTFAVSDSTDVEISIVNVRDSSVVRHLAAGKLGGNAPLPLVANSLSQALTWDGKDDFGRAAAHPESLSVRVRAGMTPVLANLAAEDLYTFNVGTPSMLTDTTDHSVYILGWAGTGGMTYLRKYDAAGNYLKTLFPPPSVLPAASAQGLGINVLTGLGWAPITDSWTGKGVQITTTFLGTRTTSARIVKISNGKILLASGSNLILDTNGAFVDSGAAVTLPKELVVSKPCIPGVDPACVALSSRTGAAYGVSVGGSGFNLVKYNISPGKVVAAGKTNIGGDPVSSLIAIENNGSTTIFAAVQGRGIRVYSDNGSTVTLQKTFAPYKTGAFGFERIAVDRRSDRIYWTSGFTGPLGYLSATDIRIRDWKNPVPEVMPSVGLDNIFVSPKGYLYGWGPPCNANNDCCILRYTSEDVPKPVNYSNTGSNTCSAPVHYEYGAGGTPGNHRGIAVGWQDQVAALPEITPCFLIPDTGNASLNADGNRDGGGQGKAILSELNVSYTNNFENGRSGMNGVRFDAAGNFYIGVRKHAPKPILPSTNLAFDPAFQNCGAVVKFHPDSTGIFDPVLLTLTGHTKMYPQPLGPFSRPGGTGCTCRNQYFDVDPYGRLYIPCAVSSQIYFADNAGNNIAVFGQYGNTDSRGPLSGPGKTYSQPDIPIGWPTSVGASEDYVYVTDVVNSRIVRVRMAYALDNVPGLTDRNSPVEHASVRQGAELASFPNPFNPESRILVRLPGADVVSLSVYDIGGRRVRTLASETMGAGVHQFIWNAKNEAGQSVCPGMYLYKLTAGGKTLIHRTVLAR